MKKVSNNYQSANQNANILHTDINNLALLFLLHLSKIGMILSLFLQLVPGAFKSSKLGNFRIQDTYIFILSVPDLPLHPPGKSPKLGYSICLLPAFHLPGKIWSVKLMSYL